jgi:putative hydrolase of HD superfamily
MSSTPKQIHEFTSLIGQLKLIERFKGQTYWSDYPTPPHRWESVSDHSWRLGMLVTIFAPKLSKPFNLIKAYKMALIHDIPEIIAGDASPLGKSGTGQDSHAYNQAVWSERHSNEKAAAQTIFNQLDPTQAQELYDLWLEIENLSNYEAKVVKSLDKIDAMMQVLEMRDGHMYPEHLEFTVKYGSKGSDVDPVISEFASYIATQMRERFKEFK